MFEKAFWTKWNAILNWICFCIILTAYYREGFLTLQNAIDMAVLQFQGASLNHATLMQRYPYPPYFEDLYVIVLQSSFPDLIMVSLVLVALNIAKSVTYEKEKRLKVQDSFLFILLNDYSYYYLFDKNKAKCTINN